MASPSGSERYPRRDDRHRPDPRDRCRRTAIPPPARAAGATPRRCTRSARISPSADGSWRSAYAAREHRCRRVDAAGARSTVDEAAPAVPAAGARVAAPRILAARAVAAEADPAGTRRRWRVPVAGVAAPRPSSSSPPRSHGRAPDRVRPQRRPGRSSSALMVVAFIVLVIARDPVAGRRPRPLAVAGGAVAAASRPRRRRPRQRPRRRRSGSPTPTRAPIAGPRRATPGATPTPSRHRGRTDATRSSPATR